MSTTPFEIRLELLKMSKDLLEHDYFAQKELGDIVYVDINTVGDAVEKDKVFGTVEAVKTVSDLFMPVSGKILEANTALNDAPDSVNNDPYGKGWMVKIEMQDPSEAQGMLSPEDYKKLVESL